MSPDAVSRHAIRIQIEVTMRTVLFFALALSMFALDVRAPRLQAQAAAASGGGGVTRPSPDTPDRLSVRATWAATLAEGYEVTSDVAYFKADNFESKLDVYRPLHAKGPAPTLIFFHGGGWAGMGRTQFWGHAIPYLEMGWAVVNVTYRVTSQGRAPAAVEDCRCALRWVIANASTYNFDIDKIVVSGVSAGGHLALTTGLLPAAAGFDQQCPVCIQYKCPVNDDMKVAAVVNWFGVTDVADLLDGPNIRVYAFAWAGAGTPEQRMELAKRVSPVTYVRKTSPPIITVHGTVDPSVPYSHAARLHKALTGAGVPNKLITIDNGNHGGFTVAQYLDAFATIRAFLAEQGLGPVAGVSSSVPSSPSASPAATLSETATFAVLLSRQRNAVPDITYLTADNWKAHLDVYPAAPIAGKPAPTLIYFHGNGWTGGTRATAQIELMPFFELGWTVVNVDYRPPGVSLAPGAVEDGRCALRWVVRNAGKYRFNLDRLVVGGRGVGAHLALTTGMLPTSAGFDRRCPGTEEPKVAAIINRGGTTDLPDLLDGPNMRFDTVAWFGSQPDRDRLARQLSPLHQVRAGVPPVITIHQEGDPVVPVSQARRLHAALTKAGVSSELLILPSAPAGGAADGAFRTEQALTASRALRAFFAEHQFPTQSR